MEYTFWLIYHSVIYQVYPLNWLECSLVDEQEKDQIFYRRKFNGTLSFGGRLRCDDFELLHNIENTDSCERIDFIVYNGLNLYWEGYFTTSMGSFDLDNSTFSVTPLASDDYSDWELYGDLQHNIVTEVTTKVATNTYNQEYDRNMWVTDVIEYLFQQIYPDAILVSWFLNNDTNPVCGGVNKWKYLTIAQKSDIKRPNSSNPATLGMLSFNELMTILRVMYNLYWKYDGEILRIEHLSYWTSLSGLDLRNQNLTERSNKYKYLKEEMYQYEVFNFMEANDTNYTEHWISYDSPCVKDAVEYNLNVTTDLQYIITCMADAEGLGLTSNISDEGWVIISNYIEDSTYYIYFGNAYQNDTSSYNYCNSWSYLLRMFHMHGRVLLDGYIQQSAIEFINAKRTKLQSISAIVCDLQDYDPSEYITTELGETYFGGQKGYIKKATIHPTGKIDFDLVYGQEDNEAAEIPEKTKTLTCIIDTGWTVVTSMLSEPNIYDTYYWIWFDDDPDPSACMEIMIPAGTVYQQDNITYIGPPSSAKFNINDPSIDGWYFRFYLGTTQQSYSVCIDTDCGNAEDPGGGGGGGGVPSAPVAISATQSGICEPIDFSWNTSAGATYYKVYRKSDSDPVWAFLSNETGTHYYDYTAGLDGGNTYYYKVQACNIDGCSSDSNEVSCSVLCL